MRRTVPGPLAVTRCRGLQLVVTTLGLILLSGGCGDSEGGAADGGRDGGGDGGADGAVVEPMLVERACKIADPTMPPDFLQVIDCKADFLALASEPLDATIPGARAAKFVVDTLDKNNVYFQNSKKYKIHYQFAMAHLSGNGKPVVSSLSTFNQTEYYSNARRFVLGSITYYEGAKVWALELAPYDTASPALLDAAYRAVSKATFFGPALYFHPTSTGVEQRILPTLAKDVLVKTTADLFARIDYQPLNLATSLGKLRFLDASSVDLSYVNFRDIVVLDSVPNDISVVNGIITAEFQTPLSHVNVLSQNRGTPNMGLRNAHLDPRLLAFKDKWVKLRVGAFDWSIEEVTQAEADTWWEQHKPTAVGVPRLDEVTKTLPDLNTIIDQTMPLKEAIKAVIPAFGGKASHFAALTLIKDLPIAKGFAIPVYYYKQFFIENGFDKKLAALLADPTFRDDARVRDVKLKELRDAMEMAPVNPAFATMLQAKVAASLPGIPVRFRSSTNAEDLDGFTGAGLYTSESGYPDGTPEKRGYLDAIKKVWASVFRLRAFDERTYRSIDHNAVGMALLVHRSFPEEEANGVALTANPFDTSGLEPGFYVNVQLGEASVVMPEVGDRTDQFLYHFSFPNQPVVYLEHSSLVAAGKTVLNPAQTFALGTALDAIHKYFKPAYGPKDTDPAGTWYAMDVEFKFEGLPGQEPDLYIKQARPHPGRGQ
jgi:pyruvate,water dikinase